MKKKKYKVHRLEIKGRDIHTKLDQFINDLNGEVTSIIPEIKQGSLSQIYGVTSKVDSLLIAEKI